MLWLSRLTVFTLLVIPLVTIVLKNIATQTRNLFVNQQEKLGQLNSIIEETLTGQRAVKVFVREEKVLEQFAAANEQLKTVGIRAQILSGIIPPS